MVSRASQGRGLLYRIQRELLKDGLTRKAKLTQLPPSLWAIGVEGPSPLRLAEASQYALHVSLAFDDELSDQQKRDLEREWGEERETTLHFHKFTCPLAANGSGSAASPAATGDSSEPSRPSTLFVRRANRKLRSYVKQ